MKFADLTLSLRSWATVNIYFAPTVSGHDVVGRRQIVTFLFDYGAIITIWLVESARRANAFTLAQMYVLV